MNSVRGCDGMIAGFKDLLDFIKQALLSPTLTNHLNSNASNDISPWHILTLVAISSLAALLGVAYSSVTLSLPHWTLSTPGSSSRSSCS